MDYGFIAMPLQPARSSLAEKSCSIYPLKIKYTAPSKQQPAQR
jgi:hypothetical protein